MHRSLDPSPFAPLPGMARVARGLFFDRWGTLLQLPEHGHATGPEDVVFLPGILDALFRAAQSGWKLYVIGNEEAVARGQVSDEAFEALQARFHAELADHGVPLARDYTCADHPGGKGAHERDSVYLLPNTGPFYQARHVDGIDVAKSWVIGDSTLELVAGWRAGTRLCGVRTGLGLSDGVYEVEPNMVVDDVPAAVEELLALEAALRI